MYKKILVRFGELSLKGKNKKLFKHKLAENIEKLVGVKPMVQYDRIFLPYSQEAIKKLKYVFGIYSFSPVLECNNKTEDITKTVLKLYKPKTSKTFRVTTKRNWKKFEMTSEALSRGIGHAIGKKYPQLSVDLKNPDANIEIEIRKDKTYIFKKRLPGLGGFPVGINGKSIILLSGGIDSPAAAFLFMKRGVHVDFLNFITPPHTDQITIQKINKLISILVKYQGEAKLFRSNYTDLMNLIGLTSNQSYKIILMRRSFYRIATMIANKHSYKSIGNGESIGQVASQTLDAMKTIHSETIFPVITPLITYDKQEIIDLSKKIGTYKISIQHAKESCEIFAPKEPVIKPNIQTSQNLENELNEIKNLEENNFKNQIEELDFNI